MPVTQIINGETYIQIESNTIVSPGSPPDIDTDFHTEYRDDAFKHVAELYGEDHVARLPTNQILKTRASIKDAARIYDIAPARANYVTSLLPESPKLTFQKIYDPASEEYDATSRFREVTKASEWVKPISCAQALEGRVRGRGVHACGLLISNHPLHHHIPVDTAKDNTKVAGLEYNPCEQIGIIKFDFLGLDTVDILCHATELAVKAGKQVPNFREMVRTNKFDDPKTYQLLHKGDTVGIFQLSNSAVANLFTKFKPTTIEHISAITALYRPGPMSTGSHTQYVERQGKRQPITPPHPHFKNTILEDILKPTAGLLVYQEQIMTIAAQIANMTPQEGDDLRRAIGKKKTDLMKTYEERFIQGGVQNGYSQEAMQTLWNHIVGFAEYGFNKSHSYSYAIMAYLALYLKAHYPTEFYAASIARKIQLGAPGREKAQELIQDAKKHGIKLDTPNINLSDTDIGLNHKGNLAFGLTMLKGVGTNHAQTIIQERQKNGEYTSLKNFITRTFNAGTIPTSAYTALAKAGAYDTLGVTRKTAIEVIPEYIDMLRKERAKNKRAHQTALKKGFQPPVEDPNQVTGEALPADRELSVLEYPHTQKLQYEAETTGQYMTGHPMASIPQKIPTLRLCTIKELAEVNAPTKNVTIMAAVTSLTDKTHKKYGRKVTVTLDDNTDTISGYLHKNLLATHDKWEQEQAIKTAYATGDTITTQALHQLTKNHTLSTPSTVPYKVYSFHVNYTPERKITNDDGETTYRPPYLSILHAREVPLSQDGRMCARLRLDRSNPNHPQSIEEAEQTIQQALEGISSTTTTQLVPVKIGFYDGSKVCGGVDTPSRFIIAGQSILMNNLSTPWDDIPAETTDTLPPSVMSDRIEYVESQIQVPFVRGVGAALNKMFGAGAFDWGHYTLT